MSRKFLFLMGGILFTLVMGLVFCLIGIMIGGNFFTDFEHLGLRGFSAQVNLSLILGLLLGTIISVIVYLKYDEV